MKYIKEIKGTKEAILCPTQEEWDSIIALAISEGFRCTILSDQWLSHKEESVLCLDHKMLYGHLDYFTKNDYTLYNSNLFLKDHYEIY